MKRRNWALYALYALVALEAMMILADLIGGQDPYRHQVMMMLALLLAFASDFKEAQ